MRLLSSGRTVDFLSQAAPRPWIERTLLWMMVDDGLQAYFRCGLIQPYTSVSAFTATLRRADKGKSLDDAIRDNYDPEFAAKLLGKDLMDRVNDDPIVWDENDEPHSVSVGFFLHAELKDWTKGTVSGEVYGESPRPDELLFWDYDEHLATEFERADFNFFLSGLCFDQSVIEMMLPTYALQNGDFPDVNAPDRKRPIGRPAKWNWESAMQFLISKAQTPDGLPSGPGAQAEIERMIATWFIETENASPSESQIRNRAQRIMQIVEKRGPAF